jgi:hypothetical protein
MSDNKIKDGGPAFPLPESSEQTWGTGGMSLRDYFAGKVLEGILSNSEFEKERKEIDILVGNVEQDRAIAEMCYNFADIMIEVRAKRSSNV